jgi:hypothetical protein
MTGSYPDVPAGPATTDVGEDDEAAVKARLTPGSL